VCKNNELFLKGLYHPCNVYLSLQSLGYLRSTGPLSLALSLFSVLGLLSLLEKENPGFYERRKDYMLGASIKKKQNKTKQDTHCRHWPLRPQFTEK